jgi:hypothetical protein
MKTVVCLQSRKRGNREQEFVSESLSLSETDSMFWLAETSNVPLLAGTALSWK